MWSRHSGFTRQQIRDCLTSTAVKLGGGNFDNTWGFGRIDAEAALRCGDLAFPPFTKFTPFTTFTFRTPFTKFTLFTRTKFTFFTEFTKFTLRTPFTNFTLFTPRTVFTRFTPFTQPFTVGPGPGPGPDPGPFVRPFVRFGNTLFAPEDLSLARFDDYGEVAEALEALGVAGVDDRASSDTSARAGALGASEDDAVALVASAQEALRRLAGTL